MRRRSRASARSRSRPPGPASGSPRIPQGHIQATGVDSRGRTQYRYHQVWREQRDAQKFEHMLRFAGALPTLRTATLHDLGHRGLDRGRVAASAVRLIDLGLFRLGSERYAELDHHYGAATLEKAARQPPARRRRV